MTFIVKTFRTDSGGNAHFPIDSYKVLLAVTTITLDATLSISHNKHNMYYVNIKNGDGLPYVGTFTIWGLVSY